MHKNKVLSEREERINQKERRDNDIEYGKNCMLGLMMRIIKAFK